METIQNLRANTFTEPRGWLEIDLENFVLEKLKNYIEEAKQNPVNMNKILAGNISKSLSLEDKNNWFFQNVLRVAIDRYKEIFPEHTKTEIMLSEDAPYCLANFWVNFQKQHEFNPIHNHGGLWSFVIWVKIPTDWREQHAIPMSGNSNCPKASDFEFLHSTMMGKISYTRFGLDKESEGRMLFFPAKLDHQVYPFYNCDEERISISGNIVFDISDKTMREYRYENRRRY